MKVTGSEAAARIVERARRDRRGALVFTIGTGCCESTAPFLYEDFWPGPDQSEVGTVEGVHIYAPDYLSGLYPVDESVVLDVVDELAESLSIETEFGCRLVLRGPRTDSTSEPQECAVPAPTGVAAAPRTVTGSLPEALRGLRIR